MRNEMSFLERAARGLVHVTPRPKALQGGVAGECIIFVVDHSGSMGIACGQVDRLRAAQDAMIALLNTRREYQADDAVLVIAFNDEAEIVLPSTSCRSNRGRIDSAIRSIGVAGGTDLKKPLELVLTLLKDERNVHIVMLSDGQDAEDPTTAARRLKDRGAVIETIGVGNDPSEVDEQQLKAVASVLGGKVLYRFISDADEMTGYFRTEIANRLVKRSES